MRVSAFIYTALAIGAVHGQTITGQFQCAAAGTYTLCQNLWGASFGVGSQSSTLVSSSATSVSWSNNYNWQNNPNQVKSYANVISNTAKGVQLQNVASAPTSWTWNYTTQSAGIRADVAYDIWTGVASAGNPATNASSFEIMIWLSGLGGIQPVGSQIVSGVSIAGHTWNVWRGPNANWQVISFVSAAGDINAFTADLNAFFTYLIQQQGVAPTQFIQAIQAGTEPFTGSANLVNTYSVSITRK